MKKLNVIKSAIFGIILLCSATATAQINGRCPGIWFFDDESTNNGASIFDTTVNCDNPRIDLITHAFLPISSFNGTYLVEPIPYDPPEPFNAGTRLPVTVDDVWDATGGLTIDFPFQFFGQTQTVVTVGGNGLVAFGNHSGGSGYAWNSQYPIVGDAAHPVTEAVMKGAILACTSDIDPGRLSSSNGVTDINNKGIFKFAGGSYPCRHICFSWNEVPIFGGPYSNSSYSHGCATNDNSYVTTHQVVLYEGTNIIEIHVKKHYSHGTAGNQTSGMGIVNSTGTSAFMVPSWNPLWFSSTLHTNLNGQNPNQSPAERCIDPTCASCSGSEAWRFTPQGNKRMNKLWMKYDGANAQALMEQYRISRDPGIITDLTRNIHTSDWDTIFHLSEYQANGISNPTSYLDDLFGTQTSEADSICHVEPVVPTIYKCQSRSIGAGNYQYEITTFCFVGVDMNDSLSISSQDTRICNGQNAVVTINTPDYEEIREVAWSVNRIVDNNTQELPTSRYTTATSNSRQRVLTLLPAPADEIRENTIDTTRIVADVTFTNGCHQNKEIVIYSYPNFDIHYYDTICDNESFTFNGSTYSLTGNYDAHLQSRPGCDSVETLHLFVLAVSHTVDQQKACNTYTWPADGNTYSASTTLPEVTLTNRFGCDSITNLHLEIIPVVPQISLSPTGATLDDLNIRLTDISMGSNDRVWTDLTTGATSSSYIWNYTFPADLDSVRIQLRAISSLGCSDTTSVTIPMLKETLWIPNAFCPNSEAPNNVWKPVGIGLTQMEVYIYNRQGQMIQHWTEIDGSWDGTTMEGVICPQGAYVYTMRYANQLSPDALKTKTGTITLIR